MRYIFGSTWMMVIEIHQSNQLSQPSNRWMFLHITYFSSLPYVIRIIRAPLFAMLTKARPCGTSLTRYPARWVVYRRQALLPSTLTQPISTSKSTTSMCIMHCWRLAQHCYWFWCAWYAACCVAYAANDQMVMATIAATRAPVRGLWFCKYWIGEQSRCNG